MFLSGAMKRSTCAGEPLRVAMLGGGVHPVGVGVAAHHRQVGQRAPVSAMAARMMAASGPLPAISRVSANRSSGVPRMTGPVADRGDADLGDDRLAVEDALPLRHGHPFGPVRPDVEASEGFVLHPPRLLALLVQWVMRARAGAPADGRRLSRSCVEALAQEGGRLAFRRSHRRSSSSSFVLDEVVTPPSPRPVSAGQNAVFCCHPGTPSRCPEPHPLSHRDVVGELVRRTSVLCPRKRPVLLALLVMSPLIVFVKELITCPADR